jgi:hypothetical protein
MRAGDVRIAGWLFERKRDGATFIFNASSASVEKELDAFGFERFLQLGGNFGIFAGDELFAGVKNGDATAKAAEHLPKFEADVASSKNEEMLGERRELHDGLIGEIRNGFETGNRGDARAAACVDEVFFAF